MSSKLTTNLQMARNGSDHVIGSLGVKAANWDYYINKENTFEKAYWDAYRKLSVSMNGKSRAEIAAAARSLAKKTSPKSVNSTDICVYEKSRPHAKRINEANVKKFAGNPKFNPDYDLSMRQTDAAKVYKCGNCGEMAGLAFRFIMAQLKSRPAAKKSKDPTFLHWFEFDLSGNDDHSICVIDCISPKSNQPNSWGPNAVVCDPWLYGFFREKHSGTSNGDVETARGFQAKELPRLLDEVFGSHDMKNFTTRGMTKI